MLDAEEKRLPKWPLRVTLSLVFVVEFFFVVKLIGEGVTGNISTLVNSVCLLAFCALTWRGIPRSRWLLIAFLVWRVASIGVKRVSHMGPDDHRMVGSLILVAFYVAAGLLIASPLGRSSMRGTP